MGSGPVLFAGWNGGKGAATLIERVSFHHAKVRTTNRMARLNDFFDEMAAHSAKISPLPDEAFTRESFYADHN